MTRVTPKQKRLRNKRIFLSLLATTFFLILTLIGISKFLFFLKSSFFYQLNRVNLIYLKKDEKEASIFSIEGSRGYFFKIETNLKIKENEVLEAERYFISQNILPVFGYFYDRNSKKESSFYPASLLRIITIKAFFGKIETNLSKSDLVNLFLDAIFLKSKSVEARKKENLPTDFYKDAKIREEQYSIAVLNSTNETGQALAVGKFLENAGARVVRITDWPEEKGKCEIILTDSLEQKSIKDSYTVSWLTKYFRCIVKYDSVLGQRAEITLILGVNN